MDITISITRIDRDRLVENNIPAFTPLNALSESPSLHSAWIRRGVPALATIAVGVIVLAEPAAAQDFGSGGGGEIESFLESFIPWALRWMLVIGAMVAVAAHIFAGWTADPDKAFRRKEWRNRAFFGVALAIPALLLLNAIITTFGGQPIDFLPFV